MTQHRSSESTNADALDANSPPPILLNKDYGSPSLFQPENLLREARRQKNLPDITVPTVCLLDPDGDIVRYLAATGEGHRHPGWACYHTDMWIVDLQGLDIGVVGLALAPRSQSLSPNNCPPAAQS